MWSPVGQPQDCQVLLVQILLSNSVCCAIPSLKANGLLMTWFGSSSTCYNQTTGKRILTPPDNGSMRFTCFFGNNVDLYFHCLQISLNKHFIILLSVLWPLTPLFVIRHRRTAFVSNCLQLSTDTYVSKFETGCFG